MLDRALSESRFGLGDRQGVPATPIAAQFDRYQPAPPALTGAPSSRTIARGLAAYFEETRGLRQQARGDMAKPASKIADGAEGETVKDAVRSARRYANQVARGEYVALVGARTNAALQSDAPFVERMVHFWANHFAVSIDKLVLIGMGGSLETEAIRPHVLGKFSDMLLAVERHPAMLLYLDQAQSIGPESAVGRAIAARGQRKVGLNENLAREIMELHTLGVRTGYTQTDVTEFARAMTGWTVAGLGRPGAGRAMGVSAANPGDFVFAAGVHEPGDRTVLGRRYAAAGEAQARAVMLDLAGHGATARHIATKLARHFAGDTPPVSLVDRLAATFTSSGGDLPSLYRVLAAAPELASAGPAKFKSPWDWSVSALRAVGNREVEGQMIVGLQTQLGQPVWKPGSPAGFDDSDATWAGPDALLRRVEAASRIATRVGNAVDPRTLAAAVLPGGGRPTTLQAIARAETPVEGLALLLVAPEFMRR